MKIGRIGKIGSVIICLLLGLPHAARAQNAQTPGDLRDALAEMGRIETQIEQSEQARWDEEKRLLETSRSLQTIEDELQKSTGERIDSERFFKTLDRNDSRRIDEIRDRIAIEREAREHSRSGLRRAVMATAFESRTDASASGDLLALVILQSQHDDRSRVANRRLLRYDTELETLLRGNAQTRQTQRQHTAFTQIRLDRLRLRHREMARRVAMLQAGSEQHRSEIQRLDERRMELRNLLAELAQLESVRIAADQPEVEVAPADEPEEAGRLQPVVAVVDEESGRQDEAFVDGKQDEATQAGQWSVFWRATPVGVRSLVAGKVAFATPYAGYRHLLIVEHGGGWRTLYANLSQCEVQVGQQVRAGQRIGRYQADEGSRAEPLQFQVRRGVDWMAPQSWVALPENWERRLFEQD